jgi:Uma2 family endonuclease
MRMPAVEKKVWTVADVRRLRDEQESRPPGERRVRYEVVDGELLVTAVPRPPHQRAVRELGRTLDDYVRAHRVAEVFPLGIDLELDTANGYVPDLSVVPPVDGRPIRTWEELGRLLLVVEVLSPSTARYDRLKKRVRYQRAGIAEYWIVDLDARIVERWRPEDERPEILADTLMWHPAGASEPLVIELPAYFARAWGEGAG